MNKMKPIRDDNEWYLKIKFEERNTNGVFNKEDPKEKTFDAFINYVVIGILYSHELYI